MTDFFRSQQREVEILPGGDCGVVGPTDLLSHCTMYKQTEAQRGPMRRVRRARVKRLCPESLPG